jgi:hypothetical protein
MLYSFVICCICTTGNLVMHSVGLLPDVFGCCSLLLGRVYSFFCLRMLGLCVGLVFGRWLCGVALTFYLRLLIIC